MDSRSSGVIALPDGPQLQNAVGAANETSGPRTVPGRVIPVPASVSPAMQETIAMPYRDSEWRLDPPDAEGWRQAVAGLAAHTIPAIKKIRDRLGVRVEPITVAGVPAVAWRWQRCCGPSRKRCHFLPRWRFSSRGRISMRWATAFGRMSGSIACW